MSRSNVRGESRRLEEAHLADVKLAAAKMLGPVRRAFEAEMVGKYCEGNAWWGEQMFGWSRHTIALGLEERRSGIRAFAAPWPIRG